MTDVGTSSALQQDPYGELRRGLVETQIRRRGLSNERVLRAMSEVPRHEFVPNEWRERAYEDEPLPIGGGQTISQPYIVAVMTDLLTLKGEEKVLEIGTGCGYQTAILSQLAREVFSIEFRPDLAEAARERLQRLGYVNVKLLVGDGTLGWPEFAPYDAILVTAAAPSVPEPLLRQLADVGRIVIPVGDSSQQKLERVIKVGNGHRIEHHEGCRFVPLFGRHGWKEPGQG
jgi:protein-L-isoaspartate(D-aspartate) O-methyltransferase